MKLLKNQTLGGTNTDQSGESLPLEFVKDFVSSVAGCRMPVHQQHQMSLPVAGFVENVRLVKDDENEGEWLIVGDISYEEDMLDFVVGGLSISGTIAMRTVDKPTAHIYLPSPHHIDSELVGILERDEHLTIGRWVQKAASPCDWVVIGSAFLIMLGTPIWQQTYDKIIAPRVSKFLDDVEPLLRKRKLRAEILQYVELNEKRIELRVITDRTSKESYSASAQKTAIVSAEEYLVQDPKVDTIGVQRIVLYFDSRKMSYKVHRVEYLDGIVNHIV